MNLLTPSSSPVAVGMVHEMLRMLSPSVYAEDARLSPYPWQMRLMDSRHKRKIVNGTRQAGKSTTVTVLPAHTARYTPGSLSMVLAAVEKQAWEDMEKIKAFVARDSRLRVERESDELLEFKNGSRIVVVTATEKAARGYSAPDLILLDEASRIPDPVYVSGVRPMLTHNPKCTLVVISTPNGRDGFFARAWASNRWERYEVRAPWDIEMTTMTLHPAIPEEQFAADRARSGILGFYSPRHYLHEEQQENLQEMGVRMYRQEYLCEFVETQDAVFRYADIDAMMAKTDDDLARGGIEEHEMEALTFA